MLITAIFILFLSINKCLANLSSLKINLRRLFGREVKDKSLKGSRVKISCFGKKPPSKSFRSFSWIHAGEPISNSRHYSVSKNGTLTIHGVSVKDSGEYICIVNSKSGLYRFRHDITVFQLPSISLHVHFVYIVRHCTQENEKFAKDFIESKITGKVCVRKECQLSYIHSSCHPKTFANPNLRVTVPIELRAIPSRRCNIECTGMRLKRRKEKVKRRIISAVMAGKRLKIREEPKEMSVSYFEIQEDKICNPGFEMNGTQSGFSCTPCTPGNFLEKGYCIPCHLNHYNGKYAATECRTCFGNRVTRSRGTVSEDDCIVDDDSVMGIFIAFIIMPILIILICCCCFMRCGCKFFNRRKSTGPREGRKLLAKRKRPVTHLKSTEFHKLQDALGEQLAYLNVPTTSPKKAAGSVVSTAVTPNIRHSIPKDLWGESPLFLAPKKTVPLSPDLPTKKALWNMNTREADISKAMDTKDGNNFRKYSPGHSEVTPPKIKTDIRRHFIERIPKNSPMYNAIQKSRL